MFKSEGLVLQRSYYFLQYTWGFIFSMGNYTKYAEQNTRQAANTTSTTQYKETTKGLALRDY